MRLAEQLKETLTVQDVIAHYRPQFGLSEIRNRRMVCPFHHEKTPSLIIHRNDKSWKCYGCGAAGTVIDFVMQLFGINFGQAQLRLNTDFNLGLTDKAPNSIQKNKMMIERRKRMAEQQRADESYDMLCAEYRALRYCYERADMSTEFGIGYTAYLWTIIQNIESEFEYIDNEGEAKWWNLQNNLQKKTSKTEQAHLKLYTP